MVSKSIILNNLYQIDVRELYKMKCFEQNQTINGTFDFSRLPVAFTISTIGDKAKHFIELAYYHIDRTYCYKVFLDYKRLGANGFCYHFICPVTMAHCRKLYFFGGRFVSRQAIPKNGYHKTQIGSFKNWLIEKIRRLAKEVQNIPTNDPKRLEVLAVLWSKEQQLETKYGATALIELGPIDTGYKKPSSPVFDENDPLW